MRNWLCLIIQEVDVATACSSQRVDLGIRLKLLLIPNPQKQ